MKSKLLLILTALVLLGAGCEDRPCLKSHTEQYYYSGGTALFAATKNPGFIAQNGYRTRTVCDEYATSTNY